MGAEKNVNGGGVGDGAGDEPAVPVPAQAGAQREESAESAAEASAAESASESQAADSIASASPEAAAAQPGTAASASPEAAFPQPEAPAEPDPAATALAARRAGRRELTRTVLLALLGGVLAWAAAGRSWATATIGAAPNTVKVAATGNDLSAGVTALGLTALAGALALFATQRLARRLVGVLLVAAGVGAAVYAFGERGSAHAARVLADKAGAKGIASGTVDPHLAPWWALAAFGGALVAVAGVVTVVRAAAWPGMSSRYENAAARGAARAADTGSAKDLWDALDRGEDPTDAGAAEVASLTPTPGAGH